MPQAKKPQVNKGRDWLRQLGFDYPDLPDGMYARTEQGAPASLDEEKRSFESVVATEARVVMPDWKRLQLVEEVLLMSGVSFPERGVPLLNSHDRWGCGSVYGSTRELRVQGKKLVGRNCFDANDPEAMRAYGKYRDGHMNGFSVGYRVSKATYVEPGQSLTLDGRTWKAGQLPLRLAEKWEVMENSCVVIGADSNAIARSLSYTEGNTMKFAEFCRMLGIDPDSLNEGQRIGLEALFEARGAQLADNQDEAVVASLKERAQKICATQPAPAAAASGEQNQRAAGSLDLNALGTAVADEAARIAKEREDNRRQAIEGYFARNDKDGEFAALKQRALSDTNMTVDAVRDALLDEVRAQRGSPMSHVPTRPETAGDNVRQMEAALLLTTGQMPEERLAKEYGEQTVDIARRKLRGFGIRAAIKEFARMSGSHVPDTLDNETIRRALWFSSDMESRSAGVTNISLPGIFSNVAGKIMLQSYQDVEGVADLLCSTGTASDFKPTHSYRAIDGGRFQRVTDGGELKQGSFGEDAYTNQLDTHGRIDFITRKMMINDDLQALVALSQLYGRNAKLLKEELFFIQLLDALSDTGFFVPDENYLSGADTAFGLAGLNKLDLAFSERTDKAGKPVLVQPKYLLAPSPLKSDVLSFLATKTFGDTGTSGTKTDNPFYNAFTPLFSPYLHKFALQHANGKIKAHANVSSKRWFGFANPAILPAFEMLYLNGVKTPVFERVDADPRTLAIGVRGYFDVNCGKQDKLAVAALRGEAAPAA